MAQYGNLCFKQQAVSPFPVAEEGSVTHVHKWLKYVYGVNALDKNTAVTGFCNLQVLQKTKRSSMMCVTRADQQQQSLRCGSNMMIKSFETTEDYNHKSCK